MNTLQKYEYLAMDMLVEAEAKGLNPYPYSEAVFMIFNVSEYHTVFRELLVSGNKIEGILRSMRLMPNVRLVWGEEGSKSFRICRVPEVVNFKARNVKGFGKEDVQKSERDWKMATEIKKVALCWNVGEICNLRREVWLGVDEDFEVICFERI